MTKKLPKFIIIDGNALIHRGFHALPPTMQTKTGVVTNAVFGFTSVLLKALKEFEPEYVVLTLDKKAPTFRHKEYKEYKAKRVKAPDELYAQIPIVKDVAKAFNIPIFELDGFEADDLIGTIAKLTDETIENIIVTGDMDTLQLVDDKKNVKVYTMSRGIADSVIYDEAKVKERFSLGVDQVIDYKSLRGDPSDNIPGVRGIGDKGAVELLQNFETLDGVYENVESEKIKDRTRELLKEYRDDAFLSQMLATIKLDVPIKFDLEKARFKGFKKEDIVKLFTELEFKSLLSRIKDLGGAEDKNPTDKFERNRKQFKYILIDDDKKFEKFFKELKAQKEFTFDTETTGFNPLTADLLGISFSWKKGEAYYLRIQNSESSRACRQAGIQNNEANLFNYSDKKKKVNKKVNSYLAKLKPLFEDLEIKKIAHNMKYDFRVMKNHGVDVKGVYFDTMIASYLLNSASRQHNLDAVTFSELGFEKISKKDLLGIGKDKITFSEVDIEKLSLYSCEDADFTNRLYKKLKVALKEQAQSKLFEDVEMPLVEVLSSMEENGIELDVDFLKKMSKKLTKKIKDLETKIYKLAGEEFNINSTKQLKVILFEKLEIPTQGIKKTKTGFSTAADELEKLKDHHEIVVLIQNYRELKKLTSTYIDALPELVNEKTKRVHTSFNQTVAATGRLSSSDPNLQNIPVRTELGREIRKAFVAPKGKKLIAIDYSQIELRLAAFISGDPKMMKAFQEGADIHSATAAEINGVSLDEVTKDMRRNAKAVNFGVLYGQGPHGLSKTADISFWEAKEFIDKYFEVYSDVKKYIDSSIEKARKKGYVETLFERRRYLPDINSTIPMIKKATERMAMNAPLQGTAADMIKFAMIKVHELLKDEKDIKMLLQVHDELIFEATEEAIKKFIPRIKEIMEKVIKLKVPIVADVKVGKNWGELVTYEF